MNQNILFIVRLISFIGILGFTLNRNSIILIIISIEVMLLTATLLVVFNPEFVEYYVNCAYVLLSDIVGTFKSSFIAYCAERESSSSHGKNGGIVLILDKNIIPQLARTGFGAAVLGLGGVIFKGMRVSPLARLGTFGGISIRGLGRIYAAAKVSSSATRSDQTQVGIRLQKMRLEAKSSLVQDSVSTTPDIIDNSTRKLSVIPEWLLENNPFKWIVDSYNVRVPESLDSLEGAVTVLFRKYNTLTFIMHVSIYFILLGCVIITFLYFLPNYKTQVSKIPLLKYYYLFMINNQKYLIRINIVGILFHLITLYLCISFMYTNFIPHQLGAICDRALEDLNKNP